MLSSGQERSDSGSRPSGQERSDSGSRPSGQDYGGAVVTENVSLAELTTLRVGPVARRVITCTTNSQIATTLAAVDGVADSSVVVLAGGSNVVIADDLTDVTVVRLATSQISIDGSVLRAQAGARWDDVVLAAVNAGVGGVECLSGIPGSAGATPVQNVGAYGVEIADRLTRVLLLERGTSQMRWVAAAELGFGYRSSVLKGSAEAVVLEVEFELDRDGWSAPLRYPELVAALGVAVGDRADPMLVRQAVLKLRANKGMVLDDADHDTWSVGSFFTNPIVTVDDYERLRAGFAGSGVEVPHYAVAGGVKLAAGWLVERAGFSKGYPGPGGRCRVSTKHALALTNRGGARTADIVSLARMIRDGVQDMFGVTLVPEPVLIGCVV